MTPTRLSVAPPLPVGVYARTPEQTLPFPLGDPNSALFSRARHALWQGIHALGLAGDGGVLVPAYHHGSEIEALRRAELTLSFYDAGPRLEPDPDQLESLLRPDTRALYLIHYLGFPQDAARWRSWCDERGLLLLEDAGQAWLASDRGAPVGTHGDLAIFCVYKMVGVPDGGALVVRAPAPGPETTRDTGAVSLAKRHASWAIQQSAVLARFASVAQRNGRYDPAADMDLGDPGTAPTAATVHLLPRLASNRVAVARRANYEVLAEMVGHLVPEPFDELPPGASPMAFPIDAPNKERALAALAEHGIDGLDFWSIPHPSLDVDRFPGATERRARTIGVPVHQELAPEDLELIARAVGGPTRRRRTVRLEPIDSFEDVADRWDELAERSGNVFATREWLELWWTHFGRGRRLLLTGCVDPQGELFALLPLYVAETGQLRVLRFLGHGTADQLGPICAPEDRRRAAAALRSLLSAGMVDWHYFLGELLPGDDAWSNLLGAKTVARDGYPILRFGETATWDEYLAARSRRLRKEMGRVERRLAETHEYAIRLCEDPASLDRDLDSLFALHRLRWTDAESPFGAHEAFHRELSRRALERGWLYLWLLEIDGAPVAAEHTFRFAGAQNHYQGGRDPGWDEASVGSILFSRSVREALEDGLSECRFLRGREEYKYRYATEDPGLESVSIARGPVGDAVMTATLALRRWRGMTPLRRWLAK